MCVYFNMQVIDVNVCIYTTSNTVTLRITLEDSSLQREMLNPANYIRTSACVNFIINLEVVLLLREFWLIDWLNLLPDSTQFSICSAVPCYLSMYLHICFSGVWCCVAFAIIVDFVRIWQRWNWHASCDKQWCRYFCIFVQIIIKYVHWV